MQAVEPIAGRRFSSGPATATTTPSRLSDTTWRHVAFVEQFDRDGHAGRWLMMSDVCKHCQHAPVPGGLPDRRADLQRVRQRVCAAGYLQWLRELCCRLPFGVLSRNKEDGRAHKCTLCYDRQKDGPGAGLRQGLSD